jgi:hypothetical protein
LLVYRCIHRPHAAFAERLVDFVGSEVGWLHAVEVRMENQL